MAIRRRFTPLPVDGAVRFWCNEEALRVVLVLPSPRVPGKGGPKGRVSNCVECQAVRMFACKLRDTSQSSFS